jgi:hypothetical protein
MESVDQLSLQQFALARFREFEYERGTYRDYTRMLRTHRKASGASGPIYPDHVYQFGYGMVLERRGLLDIGGEIGYFPADGHPDELPIDLRAVTRLSSSPERWPVWFTDFFNHSVLRYTPLRTGLHRSDSAILATFQSALVLSEEFNEPSVFYLQRALQDGESCLDDPDARTSAEELWSELQSRRDGNVAVMEVTRSLNRCVAGFMDLAELLTSFDQIFSLESDLTGDAPADAIENQKVLAKTIAKLLQWRLNLFDKRTVRRLHIVADAFWDICGKEFAAHPDARIDWSRARSRRNLAALLENWKSRSDPDPEVRGPSTPPRSSEGGFGADGTELEQGAASFAREH